MRKRGRDHACTPGSTNLFLRRNFSMTKLSQNQQVLNHLIEHGYITDAIARNYGVRRLASRIYDLKSSGLVDIEVATLTDDAGVRYAYYSMTDQSRKFERHWRDARSWGWNCKPLKAAA